MNHKLDAAFDGTAAMTAIAAPLWLADAELWGRALFILGGIVLLVLRIVIAWRTLRHAHDAARHRADTLGKGTTHE